jgi:curli biogenesis system outer membrane secretion channel CsgG
MKKLIIVALFVALSPLVRGQEKTAIGFMAFTYVEGEANAKYVNSIEEMVINAFVKTKRFNIVDRAIIEATKKEKELQKSGEFIDRTIIQHETDLGAQFLISGHVINAQAEQMKADDGKGNITITYKAKLSIMLKVIDVTTGQVTSSETIEPKAGNSMLGSIGIGASSPEQAISKAIKGIEDKIDEFVGRNFTLAFSIAEIQEKDSKGNATKILIAGGSAFDLKKGDKLKVVELCEMEVNGKKLLRKKEIGELKIIKVEDENFSICSVTSGGIDINARFEAKARIQLITKD